MKKRSCVDCMHLRHKRGAVWCRKDDLPFVQNRKLPIKSIKMPKHNDAEKCPCYDDADL